MISAKPALEINIVGVRLNFLPLRPAFTTIEINLHIKVTLIWNIPHSVTCLWNNRAMLFFQVLQVKQRADGGSCSTFRILVKTSPTFFNLNLIIFMRNKHAIYGHKHVSITLIWQLTLKT